MSQGALTLPVVSPLPGLNAVQDINAATAALVSANSGATSPVNASGGVPPKGQFWLDTSTTPAVLKVYDGVTTWVPLGQLDAVAHLWEPPIGGNASTIVSAATTDLASVNASYLSITGVVAITSFGANMLPGTMKVVTFAAALVLTYNAASMILPGGVNIATAAGDTAWVFCIAAGNYLVMYQRASGAVLDGTFTVNNTTDQTKQVAIDASGVKTGTKRTLKSPDANITIGDAAMLQGMLFGCTLSNDGVSPNTKIDVAAGRCRDSTNVDNLVVAAIIKDLSVAWAVGTGNGGLDTGAVANGTYHVFAIMRTDTRVVDVLFSLSATAPTMPAGYTLFRRIGSITRSAGAIVAFVQDGDDFQFTNTPQDVNTTNPGTAAVTATLSVPTGIVVTAHFATTFLNTSNTPASYWISPLDASDETPSNSGHAIISDPSQLGQNRSAGWGSVKTNTSAQIRYRVSFSSGGVTVTLVTRGWTDKRGRQS